MNLGWMLALGAVMFAEKTLPWGRWVGALLTLWALRLALGLAFVPAPF